MYFLDVIPKGLLHFRHASAMAEAPRTLDPWEYAAWIRSLQRKLLADGGNKDALESDLYRAYTETRETIAMRPADWHMYLSLAVRAALRAPGDVPDVAELTALHERSTHDSLDMSLYVRYASWLLVLHECVGGVHVDVPGTARVYDTSGAPWDVTALLPGWTGLGDNVPLRASGVYSDAAPLAPLAATADADLGSETVVRNALREAYGRCAWHTDASHAVWRMYLAFELAHLAADASEARVDLIRHVYVARLQVPHREIDETFEAFSNFVSLHYAAEEYEPILAAANKHFAAAQHMWRERESHEDLIAAPHSTYDAWAPYLAWQVHRLKALRVARDKTHLAAEEELGAALYQRALHRFGMYPRGRDTADAAHLATPPTPDVEKAAKARAGRKSHKMLEKDRHQARVDARAFVASAENLWLDYVTMVNTPRAESVALLPICESAVRTLPTSGRLWAIYLRMLVRFQQPKTQMLAVYERVLSSDTLGSVGGGAALVALLQARVDCERQYATLEAAIEQHVPPDEVVVVADLDRFMHIYNLLIEAISIMAKLSAEEQDKALVLEHYVVDWIERAARAFTAAAGAEAAAGMYPLADDVWDNALIQHAQNGLAHVGAAQYYQRRDQDKRARQIYRAGVAKHGLENKAAVVEAWVAFEHARGTPADIEHAEAKAKAEQDRLWRAWYRSHAWAQSDASLKRKAEDSETPAKKARNDEAPAEAVVSAEAKEAAPASEAPAAPVAAALSRDREFSAVVVAGLTGETTAADIRAFFRECGPIVDLVGPRSVDATTSAALVEFGDRESAAAARTRDLKRIHGAEVSVAPSHSCTLYVTNFPADTDDAAIRARFAPYGALFDVRWPSRRFLQSRRFCYVQFTRADAAQAALAEHGAPAGDGHKWQVLLSNPSHRKERSDAHANERELYVTGLPRAVSAADVRAFFAAHAPVADVRVPLRPDGKSRGIAFVEFHNASDARKAMLATNSTEFRGRLLAVVLAGAGRAGRAQQGAPRDAPPEPADGSERRARSVIVAGLPHDAQEALIQQALEKAVGPGLVRRVFWTPERHSAGAASCDSLVEFIDAEAAGRAALATASYGTHPLTLTPLGAPEVAPRANRRRTAALGAGAGVADAPSALSPPETAPKSQDAFRAMLYKK